jgi:hypothetical protein
MLSEMFGVSTRTISRVLARRRDRIRARGLDELLDELERSSDQSAI